MPITSPLKIVGISQARMGSNRLPGKTLTNLLGRNLLDWHTSRVLKSKLLTSYVVATSTNQEDNAIEDFCNDCSITVFRGSSEDVLSRYVTVAREQSADVIVRMTADCPLIDPELIDSTISKYLKNKDKLDYVCLDNMRYLGGLDVEVFSRDALERVVKLANKAYEREHVTVGMYKRPEQFRTAKYYDPTLPIAPELLRLCVDTSEDLEAVKLLIETVKIEGGDLGWQSIMETLSNHPEIRELNKNIKQLTF